MPTDTVELNVLTNLRKLKHIIVGKKIWNSLTLEYKVEISGKQSEFKRGREYDGVHFWDFIMRRFNPMTTVSMSNYKAEIEKVTLTQFDNDIIKFNTWFDDTRSNIIREEGKGYNEHLTSYSAHI